MGLFMIDENKLKLWAIDLQEYAEKMLDKEYITYIHHAEYAMQYNLMSELLNKLKDGEFNRD